MGELLVADHRWTLGWSKLPVHYPHLVWSYIMRHWFLVRVILQAMNRSIGAANKRLA